MPEPAVAIDALHQVCRGELEEYDEGGVTITRTSGTSDFIHVTVEKSARACWEPLLEAARSNADPATGVGGVTPIFGPSELHFKLKPQHINIEGAQPNSSSASKSHHMGLDPLDPHGDGTLRPGDPLYDLLMGGRNTIVATRRDDDPQMWDVQQVPPKP